MTRNADVWISMLTAVCVVLLVGCRQTPDDAVSEHGRGGAGALSIEILGLPDHADAQVNVRGPDAYVRTLHKSGVLEGLSLGEYVITAAPVIADSARYVPRVSDGTVTVTPNAKLQVVITHQREAAPPESADPPDAGNDPPVVASLAFADQFGTSNVSMGTILTEGWRCQVGAVADPLHVFVPRDQVVSVNVRHQPSRGLVVLLGKSTDEGGFADPSNLIASSIDESGASALAAELKGDVSYLLVIGNGGCISDGAIGAPVSPPFHEYSVHLTLPDASGAIFSRGSRLAVGDARDEGNRFTDVLGVTLSAPTPLGASLVPTGYAGSLHLSDGTGSVLREGSAPPGNIVNVAVDLASGSYVWQISSTADGATGPYRFELRMGTAP